MTNSLFEEDVAQEIKKMGFDCALNVPVSNHRIDLAVKDPTNTERYLVGVECEGQEYYRPVSSEECRNRNRQTLRQKALEGLGWKIQRIHATDWRNNKENELDKLRNIIMTIRAASDLEKESREQKRGLQG